MKTIGIGSLPHHSVENAINYSFKHDIPFLPQMTSLSERMVSQVLSSEPLLKKYFALDLFTKKILEEKTSVFKIQIAGPETCSVNEETILKEINNFLIYFEKYNLKPIIFIDEPVLTSHSSSLRNIYLELKKMQIITGLHSCAKFSLEHIQDLEVDYISYDASLINWPNITKSQLVTGIPPFSKNKFQPRGDIISSSCGLAFYSEMECEEILKNLNSYKKEV